MDCREPILTDEDLRKWSLWERAALNWSETENHNRAVERARSEIEAFVKQSDNWRLMWSGGKDSTAMAHLASELVPTVAVSVKDDLDFPGEEEYIRDLASRWAIDVVIIHPECSLAGHILDNPDIFPVGGDLHGHDSELSRVGFYPLLEKHRVECGSYDIMLGLRADESRHRNINRATHGRTYRKVNGQLVCCPLSDWRDIDVYAYLLSRGIPLLPLYKCVRFSESPGRVRKSWWLPGKSATQGGTIWLRTYYPSLYHKMRKILPQHGQFA